MSVANENPANKPAKVGRIQRVWPAAGEFLEEPVAVSDAAAASLGELVEMGCVAVRFSVEPEAAGSEALEAPSGCFGISSITPTCKRVGRVRSRIMADGSRKKDGFLVACSVRPLGLPRAAQVASLQLKLKFYRNELPFPE